MKNDNNGAKLEISSGYIRSANDLAKSYYVNENGVCQSHNLKWEKSKSERKGQGKYSAETESWNNAFVEAAVRNQSNCRNRVNHCKNIIQLERTIPRPVMRLQNSNMQTLGKTSSTFESHQLMISP